ncbi:hypothetical protein V2G26_010373 [Clonostachys chloroleuca]
MVEKVGPDLWVDVSLKSLTHQTRSWGVINRRLLRCYPAEESRRLFFFYFIIMYCKIQMLNSYQSEHSEFSFGSIIIPSLTNSSLIFLRNATATTRNAAKKVSTEEGKTRNATLLPSSPIVRIIMVSNIAGAKSSRCRRG